MFLINPHLLQLKLTHTLLNRGVLISSSSRLLDLFFISSSSRLLDLFFNINNTSH